MSRDESNVSLPLTSEKKQEFGSSASTQASFKDLKWADRYEKYVMPLAAEFVGILLFTFMHCSAAQSLPVIGSALSDGAFIAILVTTIGHISGAHVNAAVTIAMALAGEFPWVMVPFYIGMQLAGSVIGASIAQITSGKTSGYFVIREGISVRQAFLTEIMLTLVLMFAILQAAVDLKSQKAPLVIGAAVMACIFAGAKISGACMNPSISFGTAAVAGAWDNYWIYWVGPIVGATIAVGIHKLMLGNRKHRIVFANRCHCDGSKEDK